VHLQAGLHVHSGRFQHIQIEAHLGGFICTIVFIQGCIDAHLDRLQYTLRRVPVHIHVQTDCSTHSERLLCAFRWVLHILRDNPVYKKNICRKAHIQIRASSCTHLARFFFLYTQKGSGTHPHTHAYTGSNIKLTGSSTLTDEISSFTCSRTLSRILGALMFSPPAFGPPVQFFSSLGVPIDPQRAV
jgi:hypothetical protein